MGKVVEGGVQFFNCPRCDEVCALVLCDGMHAKLSRFSVPLQDASVLGAYSRCVWNVWVGATRLYCSTWFPSYGRPSRGRLYVEHACGLRR